MGKFDAKKYLREWKKRNPELVAEYAKRYRKKHPETAIKADKKYRKIHLKEVREKQALRGRLKRKYDPEGQKRRMQAYKERQEAKLWEIAGSPRAHECQLCDTKEITVFDHCHVTGKFRGWICDRCNRVLGSIKDSVELLKRMIVYLEKSYGGKEKVDSICYQTSRGSQEILACEKGRRNTSR